jgi:hypothetical protein
LQCIHFGGNHPLQWTALCSPASCNSAIITKGVTPFANNAHLQIAALKTYSILRSHNSNAAIFSTHSTAKSFAFFL